MNYGLLGQTLGHSYSPQIHQMLAGYSYKLFEVQPGDLESFLVNGDFDGLNVTIPYKKAVIPYCSALSDRAARLGAVNTLVRRSDGSLIGHNSDYSGFASMAKRSGLSFGGKKTLILGSGGASATVQAVLKDLGALPVVISRKGDNNYQNLYLHKDASILVNTTPVGMYPHVGNSPVNLDLFPVLEGVLDIIYNPLRTQLLIDAEKRGLITENGLWMLVAQAKESAEWFLEQRLSNELIAAVHRKLRNQMMNTILVGMPGCGKSTVGRFLAELTGKEFVDSDACIVQKAGKDIPSIFRDDGEEAFRILETEVLSELGKRSGLVIATGGGCVTRPENYPLLHQNGTIIWLQRELGQLATDGRPLSQSGRLERLYENRRPLYQRFADHVVLNDATSQTVAAGIAVLEENL